MIKLIESFKSQNFAIFLTFLVLFCFLLPSCAPPEYPAKHEEQKKDEIESLKEAWLKSDSLSTRIEIVQELENWKAIDALLFCLTVYYIPAGYSLPQLQIEDCLAIIETLGRLKDPKAIKPITFAAQRILRKKVTLAVLRAFREIGDPEAVVPTTKWLDDTEYEVRLQALDTLGYLKSPNSIEAIYPLLYDKNSNIRFKALHTLGEIGNPKVIDHVSLLLADRDESVKSLAEKVLRELGVSEQKIGDWKKKAEHLSLEDVYRSKLAYQRAVIEKETLKEKLESEVDVKRRLEESLKERELALERQQELIASLYEKGRQLKSKLFQLEQTQRKSEEYQKKLANLENRAEEINRELKQTKERARSLLRKNWTKFFKKDQSWS